MTTANPATSTAATTKTSPATSQSTSQATTQSTKPTTSEPATPPPHDLCYQIVVKGTKADLFDNQGVYTRIPGMVQNGVGVWHKTTGEERFIYLYTDGLWRISWLDDGFDGLIWIERTGDNECPGDETGNWGYYQEPEQYLVANGPDEISVKVKSTGMITTAYNTDLSYLWLIFFLNVCFL